MINLRNESSKQLTLAETEKKYSKTQFYIMHFVDQVIIKTKILWDFMLGQSRSKQLGSSTRLLSKCSLIGSYTPVSVTHTHSHLLFQIGGPDHTPLFHYQSEIVKTTFVVSCFLDIQKETTRNDTRFC